MWFHLTEIKVVACVQHFALGSLQGHAVAMSANMRSIETSLK